MDIDSFAKGYTSRSTKIYMEQTPPDFVVGQKWDSLANIDDADLWFGNSKAVLKLLAVLLQHLISQQNGYFKIVYKEDCGD